MKINITGKNIDLTPAIKEYVEKKIGGLNKYYDKIELADVSVGLTTTNQKNGKIYVAECKLSVPGNDLYASKVEEKDLYKAIDKIKDYLEAEIKKHKAKLEDTRRTGRKETRESKEYII